MEIFWANDVDVVNGKFIFCDNDFLGILFDEEEILESFLTYTDDAKPIIDPLTRLEFLRDVFLSSQREIKEEFVDDLFILSENHPESFQRIQENALILSRIYAHKGRSKGVSSIDLLLAGRLMLSSGSTSLLLTGNKRDFPSFIFEVMDVLSFETSEGNMRNICLLKFNEERFSKAHNELENVG